MAPGFVCTGECACLAQHELESIIVQIVILVIITPVVVIVLITITIIIIMIAVITTLLQGSVWGSGSAGTLCAVAALAMGNATFWQVTSLLMCYAHSQLLLHRFTILLANAMPLCHELKQMRIHDSYVWRIWVLTKQCQEEISFECPTEETFPQIVCLDLILMYSAFSGWLCGKFCQQIL